MPCHFAPYLSHQYRPELSCQNQKIHNSAIWPGQRAAFDLLGRRYFDGLDRVVSCTFYLFWVYIFLCCLLLLLFALVCYYEIVLFAFWAGLRGLIGILRSALLLARRGRRQSLRRWGFYERGPCSSCERREVYRSAPPSYREVLLCLYPRCQHFEMLVGSRVSYQPAEAMDLVKPAYFDLCLPAESLCLMEMASSSSSTSCAALEAPWEPWLQNSCSASFCVTLRFYIECTNCPCSASETPSSTSCSYELLWQTLPSASDYLQ